MEVQAVLKPRTDKINYSRLKALACFPLLLFICIALKLGKETASLEIQRNYFYVVRALFLTSKPDFQKLTLGQSFLLELLFEHRFKVSLKTYI